MEADAGRKLVPEEAWRRIYRGYRIHALEPELSIFSSEVDDPSQASTCYLCRVWRGGEKACLLQHPPDHWWRCVATIVAEHRERGREREVMIAVASVGDDYEIGSGDARKLRMRSMFFFPDDVREAEVWDRSMWCPLPKSTARRVFDRHALDDVREFEEYFPYPLEVRLFQVAYNPAHPAQTMRGYTPKLFAKKRDGKSPCVSFEMACLTEEKEPLDDVSYFFADIGE